MASIQERRDKSGKLISFSIRVFRGRDENGNQLKPFTKTFKVNPKWKEETARTKAKEAATIFEREIKDGLLVDNNQKFKNYCEYVISIKESRRSIKHSTANNYRHLAKRIYAAIGHLKLNDIRPEHLNKFYTDLSKNGENHRNGKTLSSKTIREHHALINTVLKQAKLEGIITVNVAERVIAPKVKRNLPNYFQPDDVIAIRKAIENIPIKWKTIIYLLLITGARRGEILGLKWKNVFFDINKIYLTDNTLYASDIGIYQDELKTEKSKRFVALPKEIMALLKEYKKWQEDYIAKIGNRYTDEGFLFTQENGKPMNPTSVTNYLRKFSAKNNLPHMNPHAFRHTMASILFSNKVDCISIASRLGHSQPSTTTNMYSHIIDKVDEQNADIVGRVFLDKTE